ncbi:MAG: alpha amylase N-terminal ig-like domain-containing protein [Spirochaetes bacterium]|nr:alpha amylase N-terminal ig-like domain-containing protein [Spirochaetota bacterium]
MKPWVMIILVIAIPSLFLYPGPFLKSVEFLYDPSSDKRIPPHIIVYKVALAGTFNSWNKGSDIMNKQDNGTFAIHKTLGPGLYYYKFVINDTLWLEDLKADKDIRKDDGTGQGAFNSGILVKETGMDYEPIKKDHINKTALKHNSEKEYYCIRTPGTIRIRLRALKDDLDKVLLIYDQNKKERKKMMTKVKSPEGFDLYEITLSLKGKNPYFSYYFKLHDGKTVMDHKKDDRAFVGFTGIITNIPDWAKEAIWYQIFPERFYNGDKNNDPRMEDIHSGTIPGWEIKDWGSDWYGMDEWENKNYGNFYQSVLQRRYGGDLQGILNKLDYLQKLGVNAVYLNPVFRSPSLHKYDGSCFHHIEETFGPDPEGDRKLIQQAQETDDPATWVWTAADKLFLKLIKEMHSRGIKLIIDGVFNHSGRLFFAFQDILKNKQRSKYKDWYRITSWDDNVPDGFHYQGWFGHGSLPEFNRDEDDVHSGYKKYVFNITRRWMVPDGRVQDGVDGFRLDVAFCLPHGFWKNWRRLVKSINPDAYITAEVVEIAPEYLKGDEFDALMNYPFAYAVSEFFIDKKMKVTVSEFDKRLKEIGKAYPSDITYIMQNLMTSHDTARLATLIVNPDNRYRDFGGHFSRSKIESNPAYRIDRGGENELAIHKLIAVFQMTYVGAPMIYYGDEVGMTGANDPDCRKPMLWEELEYEDETMHPVKGYSRPRETNKVNKDLFNHYSRLIKIRKEHPALKKGAFKTILADDKNDVLAFLRTYRKEKILVIINDQDKTNDIKLKIPFSRSKMTCLYHKEKVYHIKNNLLRLTLGPRQFVILK